MISPRTTSLRAGGGMAAVAVALLLAACGSSGSSTHPATSNSTTKPASARSAGLTISTAKGSMGTYLTGASGRAVYLFVADKQGKSTCSGTCAQNWPPLTSSSVPKAGSGVNAADLGTVARSDGTKQVTYKGHPLYYYIGDSGAGMTNGQGSTGFGAKWWLVSPSGAAITGSGSSSGGGYGSGY